MQIATFIAPLAVDAADVALSIASVLLGLVLQAVAFGTGRGASPQAPIPERPPAPRPARPASARRTRRRSDDDDGGGIYVLFGVGAIVGYLTWRDEILGALVVLTWSMVGILVGALLLIALRRGALGLAGVVTIGVGMIVVALAFVTRDGLVDPDYLDGSYQALLTAFDREGLGGVVERGGAEGMLFVLYQAIGVVLIALAFALAVVPLAGMVARCNAIGGAHPGRVWGRVRGWGAHGRGVPLAAVFACALAVLAAWLASGGAFNALAKALDSTPPRVQSARVIAGSRRPLLRIEVSERVTLTARTGGPGGDVVVRANLLRGVTRVALVPRGRPALRPGRHRLVLIVVDRGGRRARATRVLRVPSGGAV